MRFMRRLNEFLLGQRRLMAGSVAAGLIFAATGLIPPLLIRQILLWHAEGQAEAGAIAAIVAGLVAAFLLRGVTRYLYGVIAHIVAFRAQQRMLIAVYRHIQTLSHRFFTDRRVGSLVSRSVGDSEAMEDFVSHGIPEAALAMTIPVAMIVALGLINWQLMLVTLIPIPLIVVMGRFMLPRMHGRWRKVRTRIAETTAVVTEGIAGIEVIKAFNRERQRLAEVEEHSERYRREITVTQAISMSGLAVIEFIAGVGLILVIAIGGNLTLQGLVPVADLFVFIVYAGLIYQPLIQLASMGENIQRAIASTDRIFDLLDVRSDITDRPGARAPTEPVWSVEFDQVDFSYVESETVLHDVSFSVPEGSLVALVGHTGAGKSTCAHLVPRFYDIERGALRVAGTDVRDLPLAWLRDQVAMVLQDVFLFEGSIWSNIAFGRPGASREEILAAARAANVDEFAERLADGYDSRVGERGVRLSGGQQQRIAIARALLKDAPILILDEATSSVDAETEGLIQEALARLTRQRTTLVIAHRLSTVRRADQIVVLDHGRVAEIGAHDPLMDSGGWYARMVEAQDAHRRWQLASDAMELGLAEHSR